MHEVVAKGKIRQIDSSLTFGLFQVKILLLCGIAQLGAYAAFTSGLVGGPKIAAVWPEWIMKSVFAWSAGIFIDKFGRTFSLYSALTLASVFLISSCYASAEVYLALRILGCYFIGSIQVVNYVIAFEYCPNSYRSRALFFLVLMDCLGTLYGCGMLVLPFHIDFTCLGLSSETRSRMLLALIPLPVALLLAVCVLGRSETPFFLLVSGKPDEALTLISQMAVTNKRPGTEIPINLGGSAAAVSIQERGTLTQLRKVERMNLMLALWAVQAVVYWGAMSVIPKLTSNLEVLLLLYAFELIGIGVSAFASFKWGSRPTLFYLYIVGACLLAFTTVSLGLNLGWFLAASVCGMFACLTPIWGILFVITTELFPTQCRATGLGLMLSTRVIQGVLEVAVPADQVAHLTFLPVVYSVIATVFAFLAIYLSRKLVPPKRVEAVHV